MAEIATKKYLDLTGLQSYDELIKALIASGDAATLASAKAYVDGKIGELGDDVSTVAAAILAEKGRAEGVEEELSNKIGAPATAAVGTEGEEGYVAAKDATGLYKEIADAIADLDLSDTYASKSVVDGLIGDDANKSIRTIANEELAAQLIPENAQESLNTLKEIADWIQAHPEDASAMNSAIEDLKSKVGIPYETEKRYQNKDDDTQLITEQAYNELADLEKLDYEPVTIQLPNTSTGLFKAVSDLDKSTDTRLDALEAMAGIGGGEGQSLAERVEALEAVKFEAITEVEINGLFEEEPEEPTE